jgi:TolB protein
MRTYLLLFMGWLLLTSCEEETIEPVQYGAIAGTVLDARTSQPLGNAVITTNPATGSYVTDAQGKFKIEQVPVGTVNIIAKRADYAQQAVNVYINLDETHDISLLLDRPASSAAPSAPSRPSPTPSASNQPTEVLLSWHPVNAVKGDSLRYDVIMYEGNSLNQRALLTNSRDSTILVTGLLFNTTYYWQVTVRNPGGQTARAPVWNFQTRALPDNRYLYARTVNGNTDVYSSDAQGTDLVRLTNAGTVETAPQLSPNRDMVAFTSNATGQFQLYTMNRDGSNQRRITTLAVEGYNNPGLGYRWSPDGAQLIYAHYNELYRVNRDGTGLELLATAPANRHFRECDWTSQGNRLMVQTVGVNVYDSELYLLNADGSNPTLLVGNLPGRLDSPSFSVDGSRVLYTRDVAGFDNPSGRQLDCRLFIQRLDGSGLTDLSGSGSTLLVKPLGTNDLHPRFSPDGYRIIFVNAINDNLSPPEVWTCDIDGRNRNRLFQNATLPDWK